MGSSLRLSASHDHAFATSNYKSCLLSSSITNLRNILQSCDNRARSEKRNGEMFRCKQPSYRPEAECLQSNIRQLEPKCLELGGAAR